MVVTSFPGSFSNSLVIKSVKYSLNARFSIFFIVSFVVKFKGCNKGSMFFGTVTCSIISSCSFALTKSLACPLNTSHQNKGFCETLNPNDCNWTRTHNHLVHKRTLNHLAKLAK